MSAGFVKAIDKMASTRTDTVWHARESIADGVLDIVPIVAEDTESTALKMAGVVVPSDAENDVFTTVSLKLDLSEFAPPAPGWPSGYDAVETHRATVSRSGRFLGVVPAGYEMIPLKLVVELWFLALAKAGGIPETLGTYNGGKNFFGCLQVGDEWRVPGDHSPMRALFNLVGDHGGEGALRGSFSDFRAVCMNTAQLFAQKHEAVRDAFERQRTAWVAIRHTKNAEDRVKQAVQWIKDGRSRAESEKELLARLATKVITKAEVDKFVSSYIAIPDDAKQNTKSLRENQRDSFYDVLRDAQDLGNHALEPNGITAYGLLQGVTRYEDWFTQAKKTADTPVGTRRAFRAFLNERGIEKDTARDRILELADVRVR